MSRFPVPDPWQPALSDRLAADEKLLAWFEPDLDDKLHFARGLLALSDRRLLFSAATGAGWAEWPLVPGLALRHHDHAGVGSLELVDGDSRLVVWRYTIGMHAAMLQMVETFDRALAAVRAGRRAEAPQRLLCPDCGAPLPGEARSARAARPPKLRRRRPGRCCACGASPIRIGGGCWPASCSRWPRRRPRWCRRT